MSAPKPRPWRGLRVLPCLLALACSQGGKSASTVAAEGTGRDVIDAWLLCQDCTDGELDSLTALGKLQPEVVESLGTDLLSGPAPARRKNIEQQLARTFTADTAYEHAAGVTSTLSSTDFVSLYAENYVAVYRAHAAMALAAIGGSRAGLVLDSAIARQLRPGSDSLRPDVRTAVKSARDTLWEP